MLHQLGLFGVIIGDIVGCTGAGIGLGYLASKYAGFPQWSVLISSGIGMTYGFYRIYKRSKEVWDKS